MFKKLLIRNVSCLLGLDRFSQFFIHPLLKKEAMTREREAVDSEYQVRIYLGCCFEYETKLRSEGTRLIDRITFFRN